MKKIVIAGLWSFLIACSSDEGKIATVNGKVIDEQSFSSYIDFKRINIKNDQSREKVLNAYLQREAQAQFIEENYLKDNTLLQAELDELRKDVLINRYLDDFVNAQVTEESVRNFYNLNASQYEKKQVDVSHILLRVSRNMDASQRQVKFTTIQEAYSKLQAGMSFEEAAKTYSEDAVSAKRGGSLGWVSQGSIHQNFSEAAFSMTEGEYSEPIETSYGFHIVKVIQSPQVSRKSFESVKGQIHFELRKKAKEAERARLLDNIEIIRE